jgi:hypothetical protein
MRSGTTPLAKMLHQMGVCMGTHQRFPTVNPLSDFEWEDAALAEPLCEDLLGVSERDTRRVIDEYVQGRMEQEAGPWGVKTPFMLPFVSVLKDICEKRMEPLSVVLTDRPYEDTIKSMLRQFDHFDDDSYHGVVEAMLALQERLRDASGAALDGAHVFPIDQTHDEPARVAHRLSSISGIKDANIMGASRGIWKERSVTWQQ